jgi:hypothetical protein
MPSAWHTHLAVALHRTFSISLSLHGLMTTPHSMGPCDCGVAHPFVRNPAYVWGGCDILACLVPTQTGRVEFGYIYGVAMVGCVGLYLVFNQMSELDLTFSVTASVLGSVAFFISLH